MITCTSLSASIRCVMFINDIATSPMAKYCAVSSRSHDVKAQIHYFYYASRQRCLYVITGPNIAKLPQGATSFHPIVLSICFCSCFYETYIVLRRHGRYCPVTTLPKRITAARDVSRKNLLFYLIFSLLTLPKKSVFGKVTWMGKRRLLPVTFPLKWRCF